MLLFAGLGNPGSAYAGHRHNVGFMVLDLLAERRGFSPWRQKFHGLLSEGWLGGEKALLLKPMTYMNESGRAVGDALRFYKLTPNDLVVLHDELDLVPFKCRVKQGGGVAGHNGLRSIAAHLGTQDFTRVRLGIGHPGDRARVTGHVLGNFAKAELEDLARFLDAVVDAAPKLAKRDDSGFMNRVAVLMQDEE